MVPRRKSSFWRKCRILFRHFRIGLWLLIFAVVGFLVYLDQVGLPDFVKNPVLQKLRDRGLDLQFTRLRWRWHRGFVAEDVRFGRTDQPTGPRGYAREAQLRLDYRALARFQFQVSALDIRKGEFTWPIAETNRAPRAIEVRNVQTELRLLPGDLWQLDNFQAEFAGAQIQLSGSISNASAVRTWKILQGREPARPGALQDRLRTIADTIEQVHFSKPPVLKVDLRGDARRPEDFSFWLNIEAKDADTPWGIVQDGELSALLHPPTHDVLSRGEINLNAGSAHTRWAMATNLALKLRLFSPDPGTNIVRAELELSASNAETMWASASRVTFFARWLHSINDPVPRSGRGDLQADDVRSKWGDARQVHLAGSLSTPIDTPMPADPSWGWWSRLQPYAIAWDVQVRGYESSRLDVNEFFCSGQWTAPDLKLSEISGTLEGGRLDARADLNVATRQFTFSGNSDFNPHTILPLLTPKGQEWLLQFSWEKPPTVQGNGSLILPQWTNLTSADWRTEVRPTFRLDGQASMAEGAFRGVKVSSGQSHFSYSNLTWRLPDIVAIRPEGRLDLVHESSDATRDFYFRARSSIDVRAVRPLLPPASQRAFDLVEFTRPPAIDGEVWGRWRELLSIGVRAHVAVTNFTLRGESISDLDTTLEYTNFFLTLTEPKAHRAKQSASATRVRVDFLGGRVELTNGYSTAEPWVVARVIGPQVSRAVRPYHFVEPPVVRVNGVIPIHDEKLADLHFDVDGGPFEWWRFRVPRVTGRVDWTGKRVALNQVRTGFYEGAATGRAEFDFTRGRDPSFWFDLVTTNTDFHSLMGDLTVKTNRLEGLLSGQLFVDGENAADWRTWQGSGRVNLRDGLIWEIPIFGIFSPVLDGISPGLGNSRAREGSAAFVIMNGVVRSEDLEIRASLMRLKYWGTVDLQGRVDARTEAELLRDTWVVGRVLSAALWPVSKVFQYKISGTLHEPKLEPVWIVPKIMFMPFHPIRSLKELFPENTEPAVTNVPSFGPR